MLENYFVVRIGEWPGLKSALFTCFITSILHTSTRYLGNKHSTSSIWWSLWMRLQDISLMKFYLDILLS